MNKHIVEKTRKRLSDEEPTVVNAALTLYSDLTKVRLDRLDVTLIELIYSKSQDISSEQFHATISTMFRRTSRVSEEFSNTWLLIKLLSLFPRVE